jgi:tRNA (mo5U34)-methyltransferase
MSAYSTISPADIERKVQELGEWFHNIDLNGVKTAPHHFLGDYPNIKWSRFRHSIPADLTGKSVLDIGCNGGFYAIEMKRRGAARVVAIDSDERYLAQARFAAEVSDANIEFHEMSVYEVGQLREKFDVVLFMGVLYHLRHPLLALDVLRRDVTGDKLVFQSLIRGSERTPELQENYPFSEQKVFGREGYPVLHFVEHRYADDPTNWWIPNTACVEAMLRSAGFVIDDHPEAEVYICSLNSKHELE